MQRSEPLKSLNSDDSIDNSIDDRIEVFLGTDIFDTELKICRNDLEYVKQTIKSNPTDDKLLKKKSSLEKDINHYEKGSIAQVSQMCALSKMRIYYPTKTSDKLYGLKLQPEQMKNLEKKFSELFF